MNEILNQRIQAVQIGKNNTYAQMEAKHSLREQLDTELAEFLANGGEIKRIPTGQSGEPGALFNNRLTKAEIKALDRWCKERKGRGGELCKHIGVAHGFISQITSQVRPCSKERYEQIKLAMKAIEKQEQVAA